MDFSKMSFKEIEKHIKALDKDERFSYINILEQDSRKNVKGLALKLQKEKERIHNEIERLKNLWEIENNIFALGYNMVAGLDEAGRGPLAGPVVAAAVILPKNEMILGVDDSKKLSEKKRDELFERIQESALAIGVGIIDSNIIDKINIFNATKLAMKRAIDSLKIKPDFLLIDALKITDINIKQQSIIKGDSKSISIAAASIIAKVTRDNLVKKYEIEYPQYKFSKHKGYGTKEHYEAIEKYGITPLHRKSFLKNIL
ncbi:ribonuclease HII [Paramaledivibacter caminithermalis]|jgi:ribonuclease HII|uniref:Ribonuclease HII n=1 Tax=Paramaledivibacter caminithermalis (strain DSM 15212 / CIP 107654 / DViRD3) TaxID=1121301 RepID=A0A1M6NKN0_PARC5|nr:ribonuclease HII [Paramaledivibacter caminithermalis]SHJ96082.1 RNase HII [Paramaledivibacter caminithermalis DSM 15212]